MSTRQNRSQLIAAVVTVALALYLATLAPTREIAWVSAFLLFTVYLFVFELVAVDVAAITVMVLLGLTTPFAAQMGLGHGLVATSSLFNGFASNAVISIIAVMIIGAGLDKTGLMNRVAAAILRIGGRTEGRIIATTSASVGFISSFMQNVGAAALFLPVVSRISGATGLPMSRLLMPMGFSAVLGGTVTLIGSGPLILLNDLILSSNKALPATEQMATWSLFSVTPIGVALVATGIIYFILAGRYVLPSRGAATAKVGALDYIHSTYGIEYDQAEVVVPAASPLIGKSIDEIEKAVPVRIVAVCKGSELRLGSDTLSRDLAVSADMVLAVLGSAASVQRLVADYGLGRRATLQDLAEVMSPNRTGFAELVIPPSSKLIGRSARELWLRKSYGLSLLALHRAGKTSREGEGVRDIPLAAGDTLLVYTAWSALARLEQDPNFVVVTSDYPHEALRPHKVVPALGFFLLALVLVFMEVRLSVALLTGAIGMVLARVLTIEEAYQSVSWKTVFLLASLIPLGLAVETSGTAKWVAEQTLAVVGGMPVWVIQAAVAVLATFFTLVMSNIGATVLLVPLAVNIAIGVGASPAVFALTVAIATSNSFLIPTHQVNALIMGPAGYRVADFMRAGGIMTVLFLVVLIAMMNLVY